MSGLFGSTVLETAIGLIVVYILLSTICSAIQETLAGFLKLRAKDLERGIQNMLCDGDLARAVLTHPLIKSLGSTRTETTAVQGAALKGAVTEGRPVNTRRQQRRRWTFAGKPSYIPAALFTTALFDSLPPVVDDPTTVTAPTTVTDIREKAEALAKDADPEKQSIGRALLSLIAQSQSPAELGRQVTRVKQIVDTLPQTDPGEARARDAIKLAWTFEDIRAVIQDIGPDSPAASFSHAVLHALDAVQADLHGLHTRVEGWYDDVMDRVSGVYKRRVQWWLLIIALIVTIAVGADTLRIVNTLSTSATLRSVLVADASQLASSGGQATPDLNKVQRDLVPLNQLFGYNGGVPPIGDWLRWQTARKLIGLLLTVFAVSLGAPFWFDVLNRFTNVRAAGKPPEKSQAAAGGNAPQ